MIHDIRFILLLLSLALVATACAKSPSVSDATDVSQVQASDAASRHYVVDQEAWDELYATFKGKTEYCGSDPHQLHDDLDSQAFQRLIASGADIHVRDKEGRTLLMVAYTEDVMHALIEAGIDVNAKDVQGMTALMHLGASLHPYNAEILIAAGADVNARDDSGRTALMHVRDMYTEMPMAWDYEDNQEHFIDFMKTLIEAGADVHARDKYGHTALMAHLPVDAVRLLISAGADANAHSKLGITPLMYATSAESVQYLVAAGADVNARDEFGRNALFHTDNPDVMEALIAAGIDVHAKDRDGIPAFWYAYISQFPVQGPWYHEYDAERVARMFHVDGVDIGAREYHNMSLMEFAKKLCDAGLCRSQCEDAYDDCLEECGCYVHECSGDNPSRIACDAQKKSCSEPCKSETDVYPWGLTQDEYSKPDVYPWPLTEYEYFHICGDDPDFETYDGTLNEEFTQPLSTK